MTSLCHGLCQLHVGDALEVLRTLSDESVNCVCTSPPYWALRNYGVEGEYGSEPTIAAYVENMVAVFREVRRVLAKDGTCWLNLGDTYSAGGRDGHGTRIGSKQGTNRASANGLDKRGSRGRMAKPAHLFDSLFKRSLVFLACPSATASASKGIEITLHNEIPPKGELQSLLGSQREPVEQGHDGFSQILNLFHNEGTGLASIAAESSSPEIAAVEPVSDFSENNSIVVTNGDSELKPHFEVAATITDAGPDAPFAVDESREPSAKRGVVWHTNWDAFAIATGTEGILQVDFVERLVAASDGRMTFACDLRDFRVTEAAEKHLTLTSIFGGVSIRISDVGHLSLLCDDGSIVPYRVAWEQTQREVWIVSPKQRAGIPDRVVLALQADGWIWRDSIIWHKPNPMPSSVQDRTTPAHEMIYLLTRSARYWYDAAAIRTVATPQHASALDWSRETLEPDRPGQTYPQKRNGRKMPDNWDTGPGAHGAVHRNGREKRRKSGNKERKIAGGAENGRLPTHMGSSVPWEDQGIGANARSVWTFSTEAFKEAHFATFPRELPKRCILAGCPPGGTVLDPFAGSGTTLAVAVELGRKAVGIELNPDYAKMIEKRVNGITPALDLA